MIFAANSGLAVICNRRSPSRTVWSIGSSYTVTLLVCAVGWSTDPVNKFVENSSFQNGCHFKSDRYQRPKTLLKKWAIIS